MGIANTLLRSSLARWVLAAGERSPLRRLLTSAVYDSQVGLHIGSGDMEKDWNSRARRNGRFYVASFDWQSEERFRRSGKRDLDGIILKGLDLPHGAVVLEIGCGLGRLLRPLSGRVKEAHGVDISYEMVRQATEALQDCPNVLIQQTDGTLGQFSSEYFDFCFSYTVFQHISAKAAVLRYFHDSARVLKPGGLFRFQICRGEPDNPRNQAGGTWLGVVFSESELEEVLRASGFAVLDIGEESAYRQTFAMRVPLTQADASRWDSIIVTCQKVKGGIMGAEEPLEGDAGTKAPYGEA